MDIFDSKSPQSRIAYQRWYSDAPVLPEGIYTANLDGSDTQLIHENGKSPKWSPDGKCIAFIKEFEVSDETFSTIFIMDRDGNHVQRKTFDIEHNVDSPTWSPDSKYLAYSIYFWENEQNHIFVVDLISGQTKQLTFNGFNSDPVWTPENEIVFVKGEDQGDFGPLFVIDPNGQNERPYELLNSEDRSPVWTYDGRKVLFNRDYTFYIMNSDGSGLQSIPKQDEVITEMIIAPDGNSVVYAARADYQAPEFEIFVLNLDGTDKRKIAANSRAISWSPLF